MRNEQAPLDPHAELIFDRDEKLLCDRYEIDMKDI
jgi:hypothetical protein